MEFIIRDLRLGNVRWTARRTHQTWTFPSRHRRRTRPRAVVT
jgi:hypothetical protein